MTREQPRYADHTYRSGSGMLGGSLLLLLILGLTGEGILNGEGRIRWLSLAWLVFLVPLVFAFSLRPAVFAGRERLRVRNPFRTITLPWASVEEVRAAYSSEVFAGGRKYQMWAIPVSLRQRKKALRKGGGPVASPNLAAPGAAFTAGAAGGAHQAQADQAVEEIRTLAERHAAEEAAQGAPTVRWAYEVLAPLAVGGIALLYLLFLA
ncbi:PH domain-containing protein [Streptomyces macrosporus]|uniref:PH domain-containing protein n=1 Tax=Streptomyces macrosporus TaxID=44032 RepID=A0ABP5XGJ8_9ACTN